MKNNRFSNISEGELALLSVVLDNARRGITEKETYKANWLLSNFDDDIWHTTNRGREFMVKGEWSSTIAINWKFDLPDGSNFADEKFSSLRTLGKKVLFNLRNGGVDRSFGVVSWSRVMDDFRNLICWMVLHKKNLKLEIYLFGRITKRDMESLLHSLAVGGWFHALNYPLRLLESIYKATGNLLPKEIDETNVMNLPRDFVLNLVTWFDANGYYKKAYTGAYFGKKFLHRGMIAELIGVSPTTITGGKLKLFLRQFEPDYWFTDILVSVVQRHEFPDQNALSRKSNTVLTGNRKALEITAESFFKIFNMASAINPEITPRHLERLPKDLYAKYSALSEGVGVTKFVPIDVGLSYLNSAINWVECYGDAIIDCYIDLIGMIDASEYVEMKQSKKKEIRNFNFESLDLNRYKFKHAKINSLENFIHLSSYSRSSVAFTFSEMRAKPSLEEAIRILVGACVVCISLCKPSRNDELVNVWRDCLVLKDDGYYFRFHLGKSNYNEHYQCVEKPIPVITAKAIRLLQRLGDAVEKVTTPENKVMNKGKLFNLPSYTVGRPRLIFPDLLSRYLDTFCDYVNLPTVNGIRWYIRVHEMRKWFLLLLFWSSKTGVLDACRWIAGHTDAKHIYNYIQHEFSGEELTEHEAKYAMDRLLEVEIHNNTEDSELIKIYNRVLRHFSADAISLIPESEWRDYVAEMHTRGEFTLQHQFVYEKGSDVLTSVNVSFVLRKA